VLAAALALAIAPGSFTVADFTAKARAMTGQVGYTTRNAAYDLRKLRGKHLAVRRTPFGPNRIRRQPWPSSFPTQALSGREAFRLPACDVERYGRRARLETPIVANRSTSDGGCALVCSRLTLIKRQARPEFAVIRN
jgi:hypothetical protein